jgi:hypothetical protein
VFFFPFLIYAVNCLILLLIAPERYAQHFIVRLGIYTGTLLALQYAILTAATEFATIISIASAAAVFFAKWLLTKIKPKSTAFGILLLLLLLLAISLSIWGHVEPPQFLFLALIAILSASPFLCLVIAAVTSLKLLKHYEIRIINFRHGVGILAWLGTYGFAWRLSVLKAIEVYHSLPPQPPNCYIATAAARGHRSIVQAQPVLLASGPLWVNPQLQYLKCAELALMVLAPNLHRPLRRIYDIIGKALAQRMTNPFVADLAYLALKPFEWLARLLLKAFIPEIDRYTRLIYRIQQTD